MPKPTTPAHGWWGEHWLEYLHDEAHMQPLTSTQIKGAERGDAKLAVTRGKVVAKVGVGASGVHTASLKVKPLTERDWKRVLEEIGHDPAVANRLLTGTPGAELREAFAAAGLDLFPSGPVMRCTCWENWGCRHTRVLAVRGAALFDANPFLWLEVLGRRREDLLAAVRARLADQAGRPDAASPDGGPAAAAIAAERFLTGPADPSAIEVRAGATATPDALLRLLGALPLPPDIGRTARVAEQEMTRNGLIFRTTGWVRESVDDVLARYLSHISHAATGLATGEQSPRFVEEPLPGKRIALKVRLAAEIAAVVAGKESPVSLWELYGECPTAAALPWAEAEPALAGALAELPDELVTLAGRHVALRSAVLAGLRFRHVVSFSEWRAQALLMDADWVRVLELAGFGPPYAIEPGVFEVLAPEVGDELELTVADPAGPLLVATLHRRIRRDDGEVLAAGRAAVQVLRRHLAGAWGATLSERDAVEILLAEGFYRDGESPDPVWLLPSPALGQELFWGRGRTLTAEVWRQAAPSFGQRLYGGWQDRQNVLHQFGQSLSEAGHTRKEVDAALECVAAWCRHWHADQTDLRNPPAPGAFVAFLWNVAPGEALKLRGMPPETLPQMLGAWFRFLEGLNPLAAGVYREHLAACGLEEAFLHRVLTFQGGRGGRERSEAWLLEGYRWMGPELVFSNA